MSGCLRHNISSVSVIGCGDVMCIQGDLYVGGIYCGPQTSTARAKSSHQCTHSTPSPSVTAETAAAKTEVVVHADIPPQQDISDQQN